MHEPLFNIAGYLTEIARSQPDTLAIALPVGRSTNGQVKYRELSYRELNEESDVVAFALQAAGIKRGMATALMVRPGPEFFSLTFALAKLGAVPIVIDPGIGLRNIKTCLGEAEPEAFIGIPQAHAARFALGWGRATLRHLVTVGRRAWFGGITLDEARQLAGFGKERAPGDAVRSFSLAPTALQERAAVLFTSGSTGVPKGAVYTHGNFAAQVSTLRRISGVQKGEVDLPTLPVFALFDPALGMSTIVPDMDPTRPAQVDPRKLISAIEQFKVTNLFASPAVLNVLARYGAEHDVVLPSVKRVVCAGAPVQPIIMERCLKMLGKDARIVTPYGATEALPVSSVDSNEILQPEIRELTASGAGVLVGQPVDEVRVSIIEIGDHPLEKWHDELLVSQGEIGEIVVEGDLVTEEYQNRSLSTKLAKIPLPGGFAHRMGDLGYFDKGGRLWFCGRKTHRVRVERKTFFSVPCEMIVNDHAEVYRSALVQVLRKNTVVPIIVVERETNSRSSVKKLELELMGLIEKFERSRGIEGILFHKSFPVDIRHNAKIDRGRLGRWAQGRWAQGRWAQGRNK